MNAQWTKVSEYLNRYRQVRQRFERPKAYSPDARYPPGSGYLVAQITRANFAQLESGKILAVETANEFTLFLIFKP